MDSSIVRAHAAANRRHTLWLIVVQCAVAALAGYVLFGDEGMVVTLGVVALALVFEPWAAGPLTLAYYRARPIRFHESPTLWATIETLARRAGLPVVPNLYLLPSAQANAFAVGQAHRSAIAISGGLLNALTPRELAAVLAHEVGHIVNGDLRVMSLADYVSRLTALLALIGLGAVVLMSPSWLFGDAPIPWLGLLILIAAPQVSQLAQAGLSRVREFDADLTAAQLIGDPEALASALARIEGGVRTRRGWWLPGRRDDVPSIARTHPPTAERMRRLLALGRPALIDRFGL